MPNALAHSLTRWFKRNKSTHETDDLVISIKVDKKILPLIQLLWNAGYHTQWSCEGDPGDHPAYITFTCEAEALSFAEIGLKDEEKVQIDRAESSYCKDRTTVRFPTSAIERATTRVQDNVELLFQRYGEIINEGLAHFKD